MITSKPFATIVILSAFLALPACQSSTGVGESFRKNMHEKIMHSYCFKYMYGQDGAATIDYDKAHSWCAKSIISGNASAMTLMAEMYFFGLGRHIDYDKSFYWYQQAANLEHSHAQFMVAHSYRYGYGVEPSIELAMEWEEKSMYNGHQKPFEVSPKTPQGSKHLRKHHSTKHTGQ